MWGLGWLRGKFRGVLRVLWRRLNADRVLCGSLLFAWEDGECNTELFIAVATDTEQKERHRTRGDVWVRVVVRKVAHLRSAISEWHPPYPHTVVSRCALNYAYGVYHVASLRLANASNLSADTALRSRRTPVPDFSAAIPLCAHAISSPQPSAVTPRLGEVQHGKPHPSQWSAERDVDRVEGLGAYSIELSLIHI